MVSPDGSEVVVSVEIEYEWSDVAVVPRRGQFQEPPLPGTRSFDRVRGRAGNLIVVQLRSGNGRGIAERAALRSLDLKGPGTASLRNSADRSATGNIRAVRHLVGVIELGGVYYRSEAEPRLGAIEGDGFERPKYGTNSRPAQLIRDADGDYFGYESRRDRVYLYWSTGLSLGACLRAFESALDRSAQDDPGSSAAGIVANGDFTLVTGSRNDVRSAALEAAEPTFVRLDAADWTLGWRAPYQRFDDRETFRAELSLEVSPTDLATARRTVRLTAAEGFIDAAGPRVEYRARGSMLYEDM